ncbi:MAG: primosomal protein N' [Prevotellaceae bacterium]|jgi:primosomal protein N' (replication factor Y)|nr:primosomal protein N' [Prevotellaceae bacterium]
MLYINVILPLPLANTFTYSVPEPLAEKVKIAMRVVVPFGKKKLYTGIVQLIHSQPPATVYEIKEIAGIVDDKPLLRHPQLPFWEWISNYYQAFIGDVYQAAVPAGLKLQSESNVRINPDFEAEKVLSDKEESILNALSDGNTASIAELEKRTGIKNIVSTINKLLEINAIEVNENLVEKFREKQETFVRLNEKMRIETNLQKAFDDLNRAKKQLDLLMVFIEMSHCLHPHNQLEVSKKDLLKKADASPAMLANLVEKQILETYEKTIGRLDFSDFKTEPISPLADFQQQAFNQINAQFAEKQVVLMHGVTSSGKTEIYIHLIKNCIDQGKQALLLVPEIALTTQLTTRLKRIFGNRLGVYHSKFSDSERVEVWNHLLNDTAYDVIIGVRSSIFLPFRKLGIVIVDEEHELSYKQFDPAPRYHARNAAIVLAQMHGAKTLLGTATPAIESYFNATNGKYGLVTINQRYEAMQLPAMDIVDTKESYRKKEMQGHFSLFLLEKIGKALQNKEQIILFQNRRGYAPYLECKACAYVPRCRNCDVSLTVHKFTNALTCHYCGYTEPVPPVCPACNTPGSLSSKGFGTEKIEDEIKEIFPTARVARMDLDTTRSKNSYDKILSDFAAHKVDILVGTQMISKGLDFEHVSLVGILNADNLLNFPDFRASERAFQMLVQVSGRAGRKHKRGTVVLQTSQPENPTIAQVTASDYAAMYAAQIAERKLFKYPPFYRLIKISVRHRDAKVNNRAANALTQDLRQVLGARVLGPNDPLVPRIQNMYIKHILVKIESEASAEKAKAIVNELVSKQLQNENFKSVWINMDIDPM